MGPDNRDELLGDLWGRMEDDFSDEFDSDEVEDDCEAGKGCDVSNNRGEA